MAGETLTTLKQVMESSSQLSSSALAVFGGTVAAILGSSYRRPAMLRWRVPFLLFVPGWFCLGMSVHLGGRISSSYLAASIRERDLRAFSEGMNTDFANQQDWLFRALAIFALWLLTSLVYWIFVDPPASEVKK